MRFQKLDLNLLVALDALLTERNVTRASERLHLSQSAVSNALAKLREHFEDDLLVLVGRRLELTPRAEALRDSVRDILVRITAMKVDEPTFDPTQSDREFTILVSDYSMTTLIPRAMQIARSQGISVRFNLLPQIVQPHRALEKGEADLLIIPMVYCSVDHPRETIFEEKFVCAAWRDSQIARAGIDLECYLNASHVVTQSTDSALLTFEAWFLQRQGVSRRIGVSTYSFAAAPFLVVGTELIATVHSRLAERLQHTLPLALFPVPLPMPTFEQAMQWHKQRARDPGLIWVRSVIRQAAAEIPPFNPPAPAAESTSGQP
ncbi:LysR family transcriptional regulator [Paraburkholderia sediminicola]|uniref:LysR family transcriptional regulator n=1 Tax=Paraburkholderia sediminicola TaxID=458836 RepID=UPI0038B8338A